MIPVRSLALVLVLAATLSGQATEFGIGCARAGGEPDLRLDRAPLAGRDVRLLGGAGTGGAIALLGSSRDRWAGHRLPLSLALWGLPGCELNVAPEAVARMRSAGGGLAALDLPLSAVGSGFQVFAQVVALRRDGGVAGMSRGLRVRVAPPQFRVVVIPDTQKYVQFPRDMPHFEGQLRWIERNAEALSLVSHVGDIVQDGARGPDGNAAQWRRAVEMMDRIHGKVPYATALGNHDYDKVSDRARADAFLRRFGPQRYRGFSWFGGASPGGRNTYQILRHAHGRYLHLVLQWNPDDRDLLWAQGVLSRHPELPTILTTHEHLLIGDPALRSPLGGSPDSSGTNAAEDVYAKLVEPFPQVFLVLSGHVPGVGRRSGRTLLGQTVHEILTDFQGDLNGGNGFFRVLSFDRARREIAVRTLSQTFVPGRTWGWDRSRGPQGDYELPFDFAGHEAFLRGTRVLRFREGQDSGAGVYRGARDTHIGDGKAGRTLPDRSYGGAADLRCDGDADHEQALLAFDGIVGAGRGRIPPRARIVRALLTLTTEGPWATTLTGARLYRMRKPWSETSTWKSLGAGIQVGVETEPSAEVDTGAIWLPGTRSFDVTASVQAWANGAPNHGWAVIAKGFDLWSVRSSEWKGVVERPMLTVVVER